jgi:hypothetical protein
VGHAIACMMSSAAFAAKAQVLASKDDLLEVLVIVLGIRVLLLLLS